jgi:hypothetical protein
VIISGVTHMKIFISWSGARSRAIAEALNDWLRRVIQAVRPFYSPEIEKGAKWSGEIDAALEGTQFGIVCLTPDNLASTWIHYEVGALSKTKDALIWTFLHGLTPGDVPPPLGKFQHTVAEKDDVLRLLKTINVRIAEVGGDPLPERILEDNFELFWPRLEERLKAAESNADAVNGEKSEDKGERPRDDRAVLDEILELLRSQQRRLTQLEEGAKQIRRDRPPLTLEGRAYQGLLIRMPAESADPYDLAAKVTQVIEKNYESSVEVKDGDEDVIPSVRVRFLTPLERSDINLLFSSLEDEFGYKFEDRKAYVTSRLK